MIRSLYWKFVVTFITGVVGSLLATYFIISVFFQDEWFFRSELERSTDHVVELLELVDTEDRSRLLALLNNIGTSPVVLDQVGEHVDGNREATFFNEDMIVRMNQLPQSEIMLFVPQEQSLVRVVGINLDNELILFVKIDFNNEFTSSRRLTLNALFLVLLIGSTFIILVSKYFVSSIRKVTNAAEQLATGDFSVRLTTERQDEVGRLMHSFNKLAKALANMDEVRETFVSNVSHEMQSPLTSIKGYARAIQDGMINYDDQTEYLAIIYQEADRLSRLSDNLLRMASLDSEKHPYRPEWYRLDEQIRRVVLSTEPLWKEKDITIELDLNLEKIMADQDLMEQVWLNLLVNAVKYNREQGSVHISTYMEGDHHVVRVNDTGIGIPEPAIPYLFDRFYKVDQARSATNSGSGLGLSIVKKIILLHRGSIDVVSKLDVGTTFFIRIPINQKKSN
ncbi:Signal transduction histidine kinase [Amphibacillus marinus]|uniref:Heme sensor protein HssS n=1 Tax=Amphibacillus marinus TaxID=872970 RepID=A0A1H8QDH3_9BACI|nr:HAMP domain-containing sensor histidine kinase [Amphibacillus marinus]SEO52058.1 Signal transduction histidine kinase [Amphibacillus marinus]